jgi:hypothetical protein
MTTKEFLKDAEKKAIALGKKMAILELSVWNDKHVDELIQFHNFPIMECIMRKKRLEKIAAS